jgi:hypothetical protein
VTSKELLVKQNGEEVGVQYNRNLKLATVEVKMLVEEIKELEVVF